MEWIRDGLKRAGRSQADLARALDLTPPQITRLLQGTRQLKSVEERRIREFLNTPEPPDDALPSAQAVQIGRHDLPIRGKAQGGPDGVLSLSDEVVDYTDRPAKLLHVPDAYALWVDGDSMATFGLYDGTLVHVHPHRTPRAGRFCVVIKRNGDAFIKRFVGRKGGKIVVEQSDPKKQLEFPEGEVRTVHRVSSVSYD